MRPRREHFNTVAECEQYIQGLRRELNKYKSLFYEYRIKYENTLERPQIDTKMAKNVMDRVVMILNDYYKFDILQETNCQNRTFVEARQIAMWFCSQELHLSNHVVGAKFNKDHATVTYSKSKIQGFIDYYTKNPQKKQLYADISEPIDYLMNKWYEGIDIANNTQNVIQVRPIEGVA